ncbi:MAG: hypothetical protein Q9223_004660 [Gallowayella weberi]
MGVIIQPVTPDHLPSCLEIYNHYALHTVVTFHTTTQPLSFFSSTLEATSKARLPFFVAVDSSLREYSEHDEQTNENRRHPMKEKESNTERDEVKDEAKDSKTTFEESGALGYT